MKEVTVPEELLFDLHWMAGRYCDKRCSYAPSLFNSHTDTMLRLGVSLMPLDHGTVYARDGHEAFFSQPEGGFATGK